jgi:7,8-dihydroneopterin aldolase/epimerase/oxygenase
MGLIQIEGMEFYAYHGHYDEERVVGNRFLLDISIETDTRPAEKSDNIADALNYQHVYALIKEEMELKKSHLLEHIGRRIIDRLRAEIKGINRIRVKIKKMHPPMGGQINCVSVTISDE